MYSVCVSCSRRLGSNDVIGCFPVGHRLAFDTARGRLWVVCRGCERWNLTPLDERWEAIEECERIFRGAPLRHATTNIGLARLKEGLELVRIGQPVRSEFALWRYGDQFGRRRRAALLRSGAVCGAASVLAVGGLAAGLAAGIGVGTLLFMGSRLGLGLVAQISQFRDRRIVARLPLADDIVRVRRSDLSMLYLAQRAGADQSSEHERWALELRLPEQRHTLTGEAAIAVATRLLPVINGRGASRHLVLDAADRLEGVRAPSDYIARVARSVGGDSLMRLPVATTLAMEMSIHEDVEKRALEGDLERLERAWREAEEIASIADDLLTPRSVREQLDRLKTA